MNNAYASPYRVRLYSHVKTLSARRSCAEHRQGQAFAGTYSQPGMATYTSHYLDLTDARIVFFALLHGEQGLLRDKGTPPAAAGRPALAGFGP